MVNKKSPGSEQKYLHTTNPLSSAASNSLKDLIDSISKEIEKKVHIKNWL